MQYQEVFIEMSRLAREAQYAKKSKDIENEMFYFREMIRLLVIESKSLDEYDQLVKDIFLVWPNKMLYKIDDMKTFMNGIRLVWIGCTALVELANSFKE